MSDHRDLALEALAESEAALQERLLKVRGELEAWRWMTLAALELLSATQQDLASLRAQHQHVLDEYRAVRVQTLREAGVSA